MRPFAAISLLFAVLVAAHGDHDGAGENPKLAGADYAIRHVRPHANLGRASSDVFVPVQMASEHHMCVYNLHFLPSVRAALNTCLDL